MAANSQQPTANSQQPTANSQQPTANSQQPTASQLALKRAIEKRGIGSLIHFTRIENLESILELGLWPRLCLNGAGINYLPNDDLRLDGMEGTCLSVMFPNDWLFEKFRKKYSDGIYIVLEVDADILWQKNCDFFAYNAASTAARNIRAQCPSPLAAFESMFAAEVATKYGLVQRKENLEPFLPTDPQAEALCFGQIEASYIKCIYCNELIVKRYIKEHISKDIAVEEASFLFKYRNQVKWGNS